VYRWILPCVFFSLCALKKILKGLIFEKGVDYQLGPGRLIYPLICSRNSCEWLSKRTCSISLTCDVFMNGSYIGYL